jgi:anti-sigma regulatory factor (Ser/Thr protein kinase)
MLAKIHGPMLKLEVLNTAFKGKQFRFKDGLLVGSGPTCQIRAQHQEMQEVHARFYLEALKPMVEIACKEAHLFINGRDVVRSELRHNDELVVGPLKFKVIHENHVSSGNIRIDQLIDNLEKQTDGEIYDFAKEDLFNRTTKEPSLRSNIAFVIPSRDKFIDQAQVFLSRLVKGSGMEEEKSDAFMTCAKELILNAHRHGHKFDETKKITLRYQDRGDRISLVVIDEGPGFDHKSVIDAMKRKDAAQAARERYMAGGFGGLGFKLITQLADELVYNESGNQVTATVLKKSAS